MRCLRLLPSGLKRFFFSSSKPTLVEGSLSDVKNMENISQMPFYINFREGLNLTMQKQYEEANKKYKQALNLLQDRKEQLADHYMHIFNKMMSNNLVLGRVKSLEENIYELIKMKKQSKFQPFLVYEDYITLFRLFLRFSPQKGILLGRALLTDKEQEMMSIAQKKWFLYLLGNAYFLVGNYGDAKARYSECMDSDPGADLRWKVYNNLAVACWWHKNPLFPGKLVESSAHQTELIDSQFAQTRQILLKTIRTTQLVDVMEASQQKYLLTQVLNEFELSPKAVFAQQKSIKPMYNLLQFYMHNHPSQKVKILFWLQALLKLLQRTQKHPELFDECYATMCILNNEKQQLQQFVDNVLSGKYAQKPEELYFLRLKAVLTAEKDMNETQKIMTRISQLEDKLLKNDPYCFKNKYLAKEQLTF